MKRAIATMLSFAILAAGCGTETRITEDDPRWDCRTMGNLTCATDVHR